MAKRRRRVASTEGDSATQFVGRERVGAPKKVAPRKAESAETQENGHAVDYSTPGGYQPSRYADFPTSLSALKPQLDHIVSNLRQSEQRATASSIQRQHAIAELTTTTRELETIHSFLSELHEARRGAGVELDAKDRDAVQRMVDRLRWIDSSRDWDRILDALG